MDGNIIPSMCFVHIQFFDYKKYIVFFCFKITYSILCFARKVRKCLFVSKKLLKRLAFVVKSETSNSFTINGGILGVLPLYKKLLSIEQYALGAVRRLSNFSIFWLGDLYKLVRKHCSFFMVIFVSKHGVIRVICSHH